MDSSDNQEYPPLLVGPGFYPMSLNELERLCVTSLSFGLSVSRQLIMDGFRTVFERVKGTGLSGEFWVNGSFLTHKINPADVDTVLCIKILPDHVPTREQMEAINWVNGDLKADLHCDSYVRFDYPEGHSSFESGDFMRAYWMRQFGWDRSDNPKGIVVVKL
jgi:hypothetical protein